MIQRGTIQEIRDYQDSPALNQGYIKNVILRGKSSEIAQTTRVTGDIVDMYLTNPDEVDDYYTVFTGTYPSIALQEVLLKTINYLAEKKRLTSDILNHKKAILDQTGFESFDQKKTPDVRFKSIVEKADLWWKFIIENWGREVIAEKERSFGYEIAERTKKHPLLGHYFADPPLPGRDIYYQVPVYFNVEEVECKALPDIVIVSHPKKIIKITEIKTIYDGDRNLIFEQIKKNNYASQPSFYYDGVAAKFADLLVNGYKIECEWMFISKNLNNFVPEIIPCPQSILNWEKYGGTMSNRIYTISNEDNEESVMNSRAIYRGWFEGIQIYKEAKEKGLSSFNIQTTRPMTPSEVEANFFT